MAQMLSLLVLTTVVVTSQGGIIPPRSTRHRENYLTNNENEDFGGKLKRLSSFNGLNTKNSASFLPQQTDKLTGQFNEAHEDYIETTHPLPVYFDPEVKHRKFVYKKRKKRELRTTRKITSSASQIQMPSSYYPFIMAEMIPGSVRTRHPAIIAINNDCPAYNIADHRGRCRQVFQYTVKFGQNSPKKQTRPRSSFSSLFPFIPTAHTYTHFGHRLSSSSFRRPPLSIIAPFRRYPLPKPTTSTAAPTRLLELLSNHAANKFDFSFLQNSSSSSGEVTRDEGIENLRQKILKALKITRKENSKNKDDSKKSSDNGDESEKPKTTTPDYDD